MAYFEDLFRPLLDLLGAFVPVIFMLAEILEDLMVRMRCVESL
jgi:hypothetical protein